MREAAAMHSPELVSAPVHFSKETLRASDAVGNAVFRGDKPSEQSVDSLQALVANDLTASGIHLTQKEKKSFTAKVKHFFLGDEQQPPGEPGKQNEQTLNLTEYVKTFTDLSKTYRLDKQKAKFGTLAALMIQGNVIGDLAGVSVGSVLMRFWNDNNALPETKDLAKRWVVGRFFPNAMTYEPERGQQHWIAPQERHYKAAAKELLHEARGLKWPLAVVAAWVPSTIAELTAEFRLVDAMKSVRRAVNERAANSLVMRDMEFIQDKSAAEINNILEKGKQATVDFFRTTYSDVLPRLFSIGFATAGQLPMNPIGAGLQFLRLPFLYQTSSAYAKEMLSARDADLKRKDYIDTRINATLGSLEVVKTSDSMEEGIKQLQGYMQERDEGQSTHSKSALKQEIKMDLLNEGFSWGIPLVSAGIEWLRTGKKTGKAMAVGALSKLGGNVIESNSDDLVNIYLEKIQPALQDIKRMEELLGPYDELDKPDGVRERERVGVSTLPNFDISIHNLNYRDILTNASLDIPQGSFITIKGPSGSGKTSLLRNMVGLYTTSAGAVSYGGTDIDGIRKYGTDSIYTKLAYASQNTQFFENMTLKENLLLWTKKEVSDERITDVLHDLRLDGIVGRLDSTVKHFSGGELRRIGIARALLKDPKVLFLDEPTANLDDESAHQVVEIIKDMRKARPDMTVVAVTHDPNFEAIAERVVDLRNINVPDTSETPPLGNRQVLYASAKP